MHTQIQLIQWI